MFRKLVLSIGVSVLLCVPGLAAETRTRSPEEKKARELYDSAQAKFRADHDAAAARLTYLEALQHDSNFTAATFALADMDETEGLWKEAETQLQHAVELSPYFADDQNLKRRLESLRTFQLYASPAARMCKEMLGFTQPELVVAPKPKLSKGAIRKGSGGTVRLWIEVDQEGKAGHVQVLQSLGGSFDEAAVAAVHLWKFQPGQRGGKAAVCAATVEVNFKDSQEAQARHY